MDIHCEFVESPFGLALVAESNEQFCWLSFADGGRTEALRSLADAFPDAAVRASSAWLGRMAGQLFERPWRDAPVRLGGTDFQRCVWRVLMRIPPGETLSYAQVAQAISRPRAIRAVAGAIAANRIGWVVPCHRVVRADGSLGGFRWGIERKAQMLAREARQRAILADRAA